MFLGMGPFELILIVVVILVIFGPKNLPKLGKSLGQTVKNVREGMEEGDDSKKEKVEEAKPAEDATAEDVVEEPAADSDADAADEGVVFCSHCGHKNEAGAEFCSKCGKPLSK